MHLQQALDLLCKTEGIKTVEASSIYETVPVGYTDQEDFLNMVVRLSTTLQPFELLAACQDVELALGRVRTIRWGPRTADLDILLYNNDNIDTETLTIPHPRMRERAFVLVPLVELSPECSDPVTGRRFQEEPVMQEGGVVLWKPEENDLCDRLL